MRYMPALILIYCADEYTEQALRKVLAKKMSQKEVDDRMHQLNASLKDNFYKQEEYGLVTAKNLLEHVKKYRWIYSRYGEEKEYTIAQAKEKLFHMNKKEYIKRWKEEKEKLKKAIEDTKRLLGKEGCLVDIFQYIIYYRTQRTDIMNRGTFLAIPLMKKEAKALGLTYSEFLHCTYEEFIKSKIPSKEELYERMDGFSLLLKNGNIHCVSGKESDKIKRLLEEEVGDVKEIKGTIACKGIVEGRVRLVIDKNDFSKVKEGDILVTSMTTPEMVPIMKKAAAFVTDEGGVTCHAAIISRELKKPCVIGTKIATKVLKDGMVVEVNAEVGSVRIL